MAVNEKNLVEVSPDYFESLEPTCISKNVCPTLDSSFEDLTAQQSMSVSTTPYSSAEPDVSDRVMELAICATGNSQHGANELRFVRLEQPNIQTLALRAAMSSKKRLAQWTAFTTMAIKV